MATENVHHTAHLIGETVFDTAGDRVGKVAGIAFRPDTVEPEWLVIKTSLFGRQRLAPFASAAEHGDKLQLPFARHTVLDSPVPDIPVTLAMSERQALMSYYAHAA